jgi:hypothetical protein
VSINRPCGVVVSPQVSASVPAFNDCFRLSDQLRMCGELLVSQDDDLSHRDLPNFATALGLKMPLLSA